MKKLILLLCMISGLGSIDGQTPAFLDIKVMESIERSPITIEYQVRVNPQTNQEYDLDRDYDAQRKVLRSRIKEEEAQLKQFLETNKVKFTINREENFLITRDALGYSLYCIKVNNKTELDNLITLLRQLENIEGNVGKKLYPESEKEELGWFEKLYGKARSKAEKMAILMNCTLGKVLEVEDLDKQVLSYYELLDNPSIDPAYAQSRLNPVDPLNSVITLSMRFRFELLPK